MASLYKKGNYIYMSWYDFIKQRRMNKSLRLTATRENWVKAKKIKEAFEKQLAEEKEKYNVFGLREITIGDAFKHFLNNNNDKHPKTIRDYHRFFGKFKEFFPENESCKIITKLNVEGWLSHIKTLNQKRNSIYGYFKQLRHFLNFLFEYNYVPMFKINRDVMPRPEIVEKIIFDEKDLLLIFDHLNEKNDNFKVLLHLLYYTGLRASDILNIDIQRISLEKQELVYYSPKRKLYRRVAFHDALVPVFKQLIEKRNEGKVLEYRNVESLQRAINRYMRKLGLATKGYTSRTFRKTFITFARRSGMDETVVKELVGHSHTSTTDRFYNKIDIEQMKEELKKYPTIEELSKKIGGSIQSTTEVKLK